MSVVKKAIGFGITLAIVILILGILLRLVIPALLLLTIIAIGVYLAKDTIRLILKGLE
jgi:hypothetical protein